MARHTDNDQLNVIVNGRIDDISYAVVSNLIGVQEKCPKARLQGQRQQIE